jgi:hypothetical protein
LIDPGELKALIDELLALVDLGLNCAVLLADNQIDNNKD